MATFLRKVTWGRWLEPDDSGWLEDGEAPADALKDFADTEANALSVYLIEPERENLDRVLSAMAGNSKFPHKGLSYVLFDDRVLSSIGIQEKKTPGVTKDEVVNKGWHYDLVELNASKVARLVTELWKTDTPTRLTRSEVVPLIQQAIQAGHLAKEDLVKEKEWRALLG